MKIARLQSLDDIEQIDFAARVEVWPDDHVAVRIDGKVSLTPSFDLVQVQRLGDLPCEALGVKHFCGRVHEARTITNCGCK